MVYSESGSIVWAEPWRRQDLCQAGWLEAFVSRHPAARGGVGAAYEQPPGSGFIPSAGR